MPESKDVAALVAEIASAYVASHKIEPTVLPDLIRDIRESLTGLTDGSVRGNPSTSVIPVSETITADYLVCLEDGKRLKSMKRYLRTRFGLSPQQYREKWGLPADYPMVAPNYAKRRSRIASEQGLGGSRTKFKSIHERPDVALSALQSIGDGVVCTDPTGLIIFMNLVAERLTGWNASQASARPIAEVLMLRNCPGCDRVHPAEQSIKSGEAVIVEVGTVLVNRTGDELDIGFSAAPMRTSKGDVLGSVVVINNLTGQKMGAHVLV